MITSKAQASSKAIFIAQMESEASPAERFAAWAELVSLFLVSVGILLGGITRARHAWGCTILNRTLLIIVIALTLVFSAIRLVVEGIFVAPGPREFLVISIIHIARWLFVLVSVRRGERSTRGYLVARALRELHSVRFGKSTAVARFGADELIIRRGLPNKQKGEYYWRGNVEDTLFDEHKNVHVVRLIEARFRSSTLDAIGVAAYKQESNPLSIDNTYRLIYNVVMTVGTQNAGFVVDYSWFLLEYPVVLPETPLARKTGCTEESDIAGIARRVAAVLLHRNA